MSASVTAETFAATVGLSGLVDDGLETQLQCWEERTGLAATADGSGRSLAAFLVSAGVLTEWQCSKLIQGRHRGFLLGNYRLLRLAARGGMSTIYEAETSDTRERRALKVLPPRRIEEASYLARFHREAEITKKLDHPNIVRVYDVHLESDGGRDVYFMAMEFLEGEDFFQIVSQRGPLPVRQVVDLIRQAADGLHFAHEAGLVHRDVKPGNFLLTAEGHVKLLDLGLAAVEDEAENLTRDYDEKVLGTADYLSPEQAVDSHNVDARSDLYSLGCTMYYLLTGQPPFTEGSLTQRILAHQTRMPEEVSRFRVDVPQEVNDILLHLLQKAVDERPDSAQQVADRLGEWLEKHGNETGFGMRPVLLKSPAPSGKANPPPRHASSSPRSSSTPNPVHGSDEPAGKASSAAPAPRAPAAPIHQPELVNFLEALDQTDARRSVLQPAAVTAHRRQATVDYSASLEKAEQLRASHDVREESAIPQSLPTSADDPQSDPSRSFRWLIAGATVALFAVVVWSLLNFPY